MAYKVDVICAWCNRDLGKKKFPGTKPEGKTPISHGMCSVCKEKVLAEAD